MALQSQPGNTVHQMALFYLLNHNGEAGHMCSLACTSGLIRALQQAADPNVRDKFLPPLLNPDYDQMQQGAQFLTEIQGGSDVGAILGVRACARPLSADGRPLVGRVPGSEGLWIAAGHGPWGISTGPASARQIAAAILGDDGDLATATDPARFGSPG